METMPFDSKGKEVRWVASDRNWSYRWGADRGQRCLTDVGAVRHAGGVIHAGNGISRSPALILLYTGESKMLLAS